MGNKGLNIEMILKRQEPPDLGAWGILSQHLLRVMKESREVLMKAEVRAVQRVRVRARGCGFLWAGCVCIQCWWVCLSLLALAVLHERIFLHNCFESARVRGLARHVVF